MLLPFHSSIKQTNEIKALTITLQDIPESKKKYQYNGNAFNTLEKKIFIYVSSLIWMRERAKEKIGKEEKIEKLRR